MDPTVSHGGTSAIGFSQNLEFLKPLLWPSVDAKDKKKKVFLSVFYYYILTKINGMFELNNFKS